MDNIVGRLQSLFPPHQFDVVVGSLLGDARLEYRSVGARSPITARFRVHHGEKQKEYVFWKYEILKDLVERVPRELSWDNPKRGSHEVSWYFHTRSLRKFGILNQYFYDKKIKVLPKHIFDLLNPRSIAVWFMDDGSNVGNGITLNTHGFSKFEQERIVDFFKESFELNPTVVRDRTKWKISFGKYDFEKFISIVRPHIIPSMAYKIAYPRNDLSALRGQSGRLEPIANTSVPKMENLEKV